MGNCQIRFELVHDKVTKAEQAVEKSEESPTGSVQTKITTRTVEAPMPATIRL